MKSRGRAADRRTFLKQAAGAAALGLAPRLARAQTPAPATLAQRFPDLRQHFIFEYYPWYGGAPSYDHWDYLDRKPPFDLASPYVPRLGPYDVRSAAVLEQHARWIVQAGVGSIALSWWGRDSFEHRAVHLIMDVMKDHGIKDTFAMEPYADDRSRRYRDDIVFLLTEFGEKRSYDCLLLLKNEDGSSGPLFKGFRCILPPEGTDCRGRTNRVADYTPDEVWRQQIDRIRADLRHDFDHITLLADSLEFRRTPAAGFDGIGIYDNFIPPEAYAGLGEGASQAGLLFSFNINPGTTRSSPGPRPRTPATRPGPSPPPPPPSTGPARSSASARRCSHSSASLLRSSRRWRCRRIADSPTSTGASSRSTSTHSTNGTKVMPSNRCATPRTSCPRSVPSHITTP